MTDAETSIVSTGTKSACTRRVIVFQPALPSYRVDLFERVAKQLGAAFSLRYSPSPLGVLTAGERSAPWAYRLPAIRRLFRGLDWQPGVLTTPVRLGDVVVVSGAPRNVSNMLMLVWARLCGARTIWWGQYWSATSSPLNFRLRLALMRLADAVIFYTDREVAAYRAGPGRADRRLVTALNNGMNVEPVAALRRPYDPAERDRAILFIGRLTAKAELDLLLRAMAASSLHDLTLHVIGDGDRRAALVQLASELGLSGRVVWHGGTTDESAIAAIANRCLLFVYPGSVGLSLLHAMAYGLPAIVHDNPTHHMPEIAAFGDGETGMSFRRGDVASLSSVIASLSANNALMRTASAEAEERAQTLFNTSIMSIRFVSSIYHELNRMRLYGAGCNE